MKSRFGCTIKLFASGRLPLWIYFLLFGIATHSIVPLAKGIVPPKKSEEYSLEADPKIADSIYRFIPADAVNQGVRTYVVALSGCLCNIEILKPFLEQIADGLSVVCIIEADDAKVSVLQRELKNYAVFVPDSELEIGAKLNACFLPRAYLFDSSGKLAWIQTQTTTTLREAYELSCAESSN